MANTYPEYILTGQTPAVTYQNLVQLTVESQSLVNGYGVEIDSVLNVTTSYAVSASWPLPSGGGLSISGTPTQVVVVGAGGNTLSNSLAVVDSNGNVTASIFGSSSFAISSSFATTSSFAITSSYGVSASFSTTSSFAQNAMYAISASWASSSLSSSYLTGSATASVFGTSSWAVSASWAPGGGGVTPGGSYNISASWASQSLSASWAPGGASVPVSITQSYMNIPVNDIIPIGFISGSNMGPKHSLPPTNTSASVYSTFYLQASSSTVGYMPYMIWSYLEFPYMGSVAGSSSYSVYQFMVPPSYKNGFTCSFQVFNCGDPVTTEGFHFEVDLFAVNTGSTVFSPYNIISSSYLVCATQITASGFTNAYGGMSNGGGALPVLTATLPDSNGYITTACPLILNIVRKSGTADNSHVGLGLVSAQLTWNVN